MSRTEKEQLGYRKSYLAGILQPYYMRGGIRHKADYVKAMLWIDKATPEQVEKAIIHYRKAINELP